jgi:hypothetical protein
MRIPSELRLVSWLFVSLGLIAGYQILVALSHGNLRIDFNLLGLFIGFGLMRLSVGWRKCAIIFTCLYLIGIPIAAVLIMNSQGPISLKILAVPAGHTTKEMALLLCLPFFLLAMWTYHVLNRSDVRGLFNAAWRG